MFQNSTHFESEKSERAENTDIIYHLFMYLFLEQKLNFQRLRKL